MSTIPIRVISLASRIDRRRQVAEQFARLGVAGYSFLDAVNGKEQPDHPLFAHYDPAARARRKGRGRDLKPSQLGCFASHYLLWQECAASGRPMVVVEDDALLQDNFPDLLIRASQLAERWPLIWLHGYDRSGRDPVMAVGRMGPLRWSANSNAIPARSPTCCHPRAPKPCRRIADPGFTRWTIR